MNLDLDIHSIIHFIGSYALALTFYILGFQHYFIIAFGLGILWEVFDHLKFYYELDIPFLDPRGGSIIDIVVDLLGVLLAIGVLSI